MMSLYLQINANVKINGKERFMKDFIKKLKCLGDTTRIRILKTLLEAGTELCVCEIVDSLRIPFYTISKHIKELKSAGFVDEVREGKFIHYSLIGHPKDGFHRAVQNLIRAIPEKKFSQDRRFLKERLSLRENGRCVIGMKEKAVNTRSKKG